jgi:hypothetical protein
MFRNSSSVHMQLITMCLILVGMVACSSFTGSAGPTTWIDRPLEGDEIPLTAITIQAHASDSDGIARFEFFVFDNSIAIVPAAGERLGEASLEWQPPMPGTYLLGVRAEDGKGNQGGITHVQITVGGAVEKIATPSVTASSGQCSIEALVAPVLLSPENGASLEAAPLLNWSYPDSSCHPYSFAIDISSDATFVDNSLGFGTVGFNETSRQWPLPSGQCYYWRVRAYVPDVYSPPSSVWSFCITAPLTPTITSTPTLEAPAFKLLQNANCRYGPGTIYDVVDILTQAQVVTIDGHSADNAWFWVARPSGSGRCWVAASVGIASGNWQNTAIVTVIPPTATATVTATVLPVDQTPPVISDLGVAPTMISVHAQCGATPATAIVTAHVSDASGVQRVSARLSGIGEFDMSPAGGDVYQVTIGPFEDAGTFTIFVQAQDQAGNGSISSPLTVQVVACPE